VRQQAEDKAASFLDSLKSLKRRRADTIIALTGCMVDARTQTLQSRFPHVDLFLGPQRFEPLLELVQERGCVAAPPPVLGMRALPAHPAISAYIPINHGCDEMCTYCIIPFRRGREVSRPLDELVGEAATLVERGAREVVLLGQIVDTWGHDLPGAPDLADLLAALDPIPGLHRIRFLTSHPRPMTQRIIEAVGRLPKVCEHINLPVQAGDDEVLRRMRRTYTAAEYTDLVGRIRAAIPGIAISTDVIVGFSGEDEAAFERTRRLLEKVRFDVVHVAMYSPRPGTYAWRDLPDDVPPEEKKRRLHAVEQLQERVSTEINQRLLGQTVQVLVEGCKDEKWYGRTRTDKLVFFADEARRLGQPVEIIVEGAGPWSLRGTPAPVVAAGREAGARQINGPLFKGHAPSTSFF
ncbi:MAG: MiaB/RimO family radical SAM methylthiotransferase, partial [Dehalococcoidia bacterium]|nr:MiaB/RimO family radical SAM methylthiotransferase [Dehalococcoidia bacterium]